MGASDFGRLKLRRGARRPAGPAASARALLSIDEGNLTLRATGWTASVPLGTIDEVDWDARGTGLVRVAAASAYFFRIPTADHHDVVADIVATIEEEQERLASHPSERLEITPAFRKPGAGAPRSAKPLGAYAGTVISRPRAFDVGYA